MITEMVEEVDVETHEVEEAIGVPMQAQVYLPVDIREIVKSWDPISLSTAQLDQQINWLPRGRRSPHLLALTLEKTSEMNYEPKPL